MSDNAEFNTLEEWRPIVGYDGWYDVSNMGRLRSWHNVGRGKRDLPKILNPVVGKPGYLHTELRLPGRKPSTVDIHIVVAAAFLGPRPDGMQVNHKDGAKTNNHHWNLEYLTQSDNQRLARDVLGKVGRQSLTRTQAEEIIALLTDGVLLQAEIGQVYGITHNNVGHIWYGKSWADLPRTYHAGINYADWRKIQREKREATDL